MKLIKKYICNLILTKKCNKKCTFCFTKDYSCDYDMSTSFVKQLLDHFPDIDGIRLLGGEPTENPEICEIIKTLTTRNVKYSVITNLLFHDSVLNALKPIIGSSAGILCNIMELDIGNRFDIFKKNWESLKDVVELKPAITITDKHTADYFSDYCDKIVDKIGKIGSVIRIGIDLSSSDIIHNYELGRIIKVIWEKLSTKETVLSFDCLIPHCIFDYDLRSLDNIKFSFKSGCAGELALDIFNDGSAVYCYPLKEIRIDNIYKYDTINDVRDTLIAEYSLLETETKAPERCLECDYYPKRCNPCLACIKQYNNIKF